MSKFIQTLKFKGRKTTIYYQDPKIPNLNDIAKRMFAKENPGMNIEQIKYMEEEFRLLKE